MTDRPAARAVRAAAFHRTLWRWHFYAGLIVAPFLLVLSLTGAIYLFNDEIDDAVYPGLRHVASVERALPPSRLIAAARAAHPGAVSRIDLPAAPDRPAIVTVTPAGSPTLLVSVDPGTARVLGARDPARALTGWAETMHGTLMLGTWGDRLVELAASWALVLVATGLLLWWPRGRWRVAGVLLPTRRRGRRFWRDLHAPVGLWAAGLIAFLVLTGLPWAGVQGPLLHRAGAALGIGYPASYRTENPPESVPMRTALGRVPWTLERAPMPRSGHAGHAIASGGADADALAQVDRVAATAAARGIAVGARLYLPTGPRGVYTVLTYPDRPQGQRTLYLDRYTLRPIAEVAYRDYGWLGRAIELGVQLHMGNYFGRANQLVMLVPCVAIWLLAISSATMWWRRRPARGLGAPPPLGPARTGWLVALLVVAGLAMPLFGASLLAIAAGEALWQALTQRRSFATSPAHVDPPDP